MSHLNDGLYCSHDHHNDPYHHDDKGDYLVTRAQTGLREFQVAGSWDDEGKRDGRQTALCVCVGGGGRLYVCMCGCACVCVFKR